jgi:predicted nucleic acid-binding protein
VAWYVDTSAFVKLVVAEKHTPAMRRWAEAQDDQLFSCDLLRTEALRAARRHSPAALLEARLRLDTLVLLRLTTDICERAAELDPQIMRSLDALHLAAALTVTELDGVVTYDERLADACRVHGVAVTAPSR